MGNEYPAVDRYGNRGTFRPYSSGGGCFSGLIFWGALVVIIIGFAIFGVGALINKIKANALPFHDSLRNISSGSNGTQYHPWCTSDGDGYHVISAVCWYSDVNYADVDITVTAQTSGGTNSGYGILFRVSGTYQDEFAVTADGKWFYTDGNYPNDYGGCAGCYGSLPLTTSSAIHKGRNATNTLEVKTQGQSFIFIVNGVKVGEETSSSNVTEGSIAFVSGVYTAVPDDLEIHYYGNLQINGEGNTETTFTDLTVDRYG